MVRPLDTLFVIAAGGRARWVKRREGGGDFVTIREFHAPEATAEHPAGVVFASAGGARFNVEPRSTQKAKAHERFAEELADAVNQAALAHQVQRLAIVAPARIRTLICSRLNDQAAPHLARVLDKDLSKVPDDQLADWLHPLEL